MTADKAFRYGGEEFTLIFAGKSAQEATAHLEVLREAIAAADFTARAKGRPRRKPKQDAPGASAAAGIASVPVRPLCS